MATITVTPAQTFVSGDTVTPTNLNALGTPTVAISGIVAADISSAAITTDKIADGAITQSKLNSSVTTVPSGAVMAFAMNSAPTGWLAANGAAVSRSTYAALFAVIGTAHGVGDGSTTFNLPDLRGIFVRGSGSQTINGTTYNKTFAAKENDDLKAHSHTIGAVVEISTNGNISTAYHTGPATGTTIATSSVGGAETRPANIALLYCIKT